jgi:hypothetical protein
MDTLRIDIRDRKTFLRKAKQRVGRSYTGPALDRDGWKLLSSWHEFRPF